MAVPVAGLFRQALLAPADPGTSHRARRSGKHEKPVLNVDLNIRDFDGRAVVVLRGELNLADTPGVASHLIAAVAACGPSVIVDLAGLEGIGYSGLSVLLRVRKWTRQSGGDLPLAAPQQPVRQILEATGLIDVFSVYPSVEEAVSSTRQAQAWSPTAPQRVPADMVTRSGGRRPVCRAARPSLVRPLPRRGVCGAGHVARGACVKWRSPGGTTAA
jgi:anti-sigma B factor antagonist